jgi:hypothetical protein
MFDPKQHLIQLPRRVKDRATGQYVTVHDDYLEVKWRLVWFRERCPHGSIRTEALSLDWEQGVAIYKATVEDGDGGLATGTGTETRTRFEDFVEKAETRAVGRALAALGIGTQFVGAELSEGDHVADAPVAQPNGYAVEPVRRPVPSPGDRNGQALPEAGRITRDQARELKKLAQTTFGFAEGERQLRHDPGFEVDEPLTLMRLVTSVSPERYQALVDNYTAHRTREVEADAP